MHFTYGGVAAQLQRYLNSNIMLQEIGFFRLYSFKGKVAELAKEMDKVWNDLMLRISIVAKRDNFTPIEVQMAVAEANNKFMACVDEFGTVI